MRYLTPEAKARELAEWEARKAEPIPLGNQGGRGYPDPPIFPWVDRLNAIPGVCTLQSCAGHPARAGNPFEHGHLWLWLDEGMAAAFQDRVFELLALDGVESVAALYKPWGQEIMDVVFAGDDAGRLDDSMGAIVGFFEGLA